MTKKKKKRKMMMQKKKQNEKKFGGWGTFLIPVNAVERAWHT